MFRDSIIVPLLFIKWNMLIYFIKCCSSCQNFERFSIKTFTACILNGGGKNGFLVGKNILDITMVCGPPKHNSS